MNNTTYTIIKKSAALLLAAVMLLTAYIVPVKHASADSGSAAKDPVIAAAGSMAEAANRGTMCPPITEDFSNITVLITISKGDNKVNDIQLKLRGEYYFENDMRCIRDDTSNSYTVSIVNRNGTIYAYDHSGNLITSGTELRLNKVYIGRDAGYATLFTRGCNLPSYPYGTNNNNYLGNFIFDAKAEGNYLRMRNVVPLEYYVYGVMEHEMSYDSEPAALRAQAIAAKCFGLSLKGYYTDYDVMDGYSDSMNQMYRGYTLDWDRIIVIEHSSYVVGKAIAYDGRIIPTYYGASNGGETTLPSMAFGGWEAWYNTAFSITLDEADAEISSAYCKTAEITYGAQTPTNKEYTNRFRDFILAKARATLGGNYNKVLSISSVSAFDPLPRTQRNMRQLQFTAEVVDTNYTPTPAPTADPDDPDATPAPTADPNPVPVTFTCTCPTSELKSLHIADYDGSGETYNSSMPGVFYSNYLMYWGKSTSAGYDLYFCRYGHGAGMSQKGARAWAEPQFGSKTCEEILAFYFPGCVMVDITEADADAPFASTLTTAAYGRCTGANVNVRTAPSLTESVILGVAHTDDHLDIISVTPDGEWYRVLWNGHYGYINYKFVRIDMFPSPAGAEFTLYTGIAGSGAVLRSAPTDLVGGIVNISGSRVTVWAEIGDWYFVVTQTGNSGFVRRDRVTIMGQHQYDGSEPIPGAPTPHYYSTGDERPVKPGLGKRNAG